MNHPLSPKFVNMNPARLLVALAFSTALGAAGAWWALRPTPPSVPDSPAVLTQVREVARLETLQVTLYKKLVFAPDPKETGSLWGDVASWARYSVNRPEGRAILFADAQIGLDLDALGPNSLRVTGATVEVVLPPLDVQVLLRPEETEVLGSNLNSAETAELFALAKRAFERQIQEDASLQQKARASAERSLKGLLLGLGFREVRFVSALTATNQG